MARITAIVSTRISANVTFYVSKTRSQKVSIFQIGAK